MMLPGGQSIINAFLRVSSIQPIIIEDLLLVVSLRVFLVTSNRKSSFSSLKIQKEFIDKPSGKVAINQVKLGLEFHQRPSFFSLFSSDLLIICFILRQAAL